MDYIARIIFECVKDAREKQPVDLADVIGAIDCHERMIATIDELNGAIGALIKERKIAETGRLRFYDPAGTPTPRTFTPLNAQEYHAAVRTNSERFKAALKQSEQEEYEFVRHKITVRWKLPGGNYPADADEEKAYELTRRLEEILNRGGRAEINGHEFGPGEIDILVFGRDTDDDTDSIYGDIKSAFRTTECPKGSCIIRYYQDRGEEKVSDVV